MVSPVHLVCNYSNRSLISFGDILLLEMDGKGWQKRGERGGGIGEGGSLWNNPANQPASQPASNISILVYLFN